MLMDVTAPQNLGPYCLSIASALELGQQRVKNAIRDLSPEQLAATVPGLTNSIATLVVHICGTEVGLAYMLLGQELPAALAAEYLLDQPRSPLPADTGETVDSLLPHHQGQHLGQIQVIRKLITAAPR